MSDGPALDIKAVIALCSKLDLEESSEMSNTCCQGVFISHMLHVWNVYLHFTMDSSIWSIISIHGAYDSPELEDAKKVVGLFRGPKGCISLKALVFSRGSSCDSCDDLLSLVIQKSTRRIGS